MARYEATIASAWPADDTFRYLATFSNAEQWDPGVRSGRVLDPGPVRAGSRFVLVVPFAGRDLPLTYQVTEYSETERRVVLDAASTLLRARDVITVTPATEAGAGTATEAGAGTATEAGAGTATEAGAAASRRASVSYQAEVTLRGPLRLLDPVLARGFRAVGDRAANGLRGMLTTAAPPVEFTGRTRSS